MTDIKLLKLFGGANFENILYKITACFKRNFEIDFL